MELSLWDLSVSELSGCELNVWLFNVCALNRRLGIALRSVKAPDAGLAADRR
jgi:hypothetical protein